MTVDLAKHNPDDASDDETGAELELRPLGEVEQWTPTVQTLVVRARQAAARSMVTVVDTPAVARSLAVTRQAPKAGARLVVWSPRGARRAVGLARDWLFATHAAAHVARLADADHPEWAKASGQLDNTVARLATRRWVVGVAAALAVLVALAWWAPQVFAGFIGLAVIAGVGALALPVARAPGERAVCTLVALALGWAAWHFGPELAALVPRPPWWAWWVLAVALVVTFGVLGRKEDQHLVEMPQLAVDIDAPQRPTADMVIDALCRLGIKDLTAANLDKVREETRVIAPGVGRSRRGWHLQLELPWAVTAGSVMEKREGLAGALKRELGTVWPSQGHRHPGHLVLFLSDRPMSTAPQEPWPIAETRRVDIFEPIPMFTDQEGRWISLQVAYKRILIGGESGSGKSFYVRQIGVACALDPRVRLLVFDGKANGDMDPLMPVAHGFYVGAQAEEMAEQLVALQRLEREMDRRARFLRTLPREENPENKVTSALVDRYPHLAPYEVIVDELQEYTQNEDKTMAKEFTRIFTRLSRLGRSAGIWLTIATQYPADGVVPVAMRSNFSTKFCLRVEGHQQVEVILGTGSYAAGLKSNLFTQSEAGLSWHKGDGQDPAIVQSVRGLDGPACDELVEVARAMRAARGLLTGQAANDDVEDAEVVYDIVDDAERVIREHDRDAGQWRELAPWLQDLRAQYASMTEKEVSAAVRGALGITSRDVRSGDSVKKGVYLSDLQKRGGDEVPD